MTKSRCIQALRYHFLYPSRNTESCLILVNVFAIGSAVLLYFKIIQPLSFLMFSILWFVLMLVIWRLLPQSIYRKSRTFQDHFSMELDEEHSCTHYRQGRKGLAMADVFSKFIESPYFFHLYFDSRSFFLIPTDAFKDIEEKQEARRLMRSKIK